VNDNAPGTRPLARALALATCAMLASGCAISDLVTHRTPSATARLVQHWSFEEFARDVEGRATDIRISGATPVATGRLVVLVPARSAGPDVFADMKRLSRTGDDISEFVDVLDGRYFFCLQRAGRIVKTYEFENRADTSALVKS
jgi:hypothetical protein